ncbi:ankyrin [Penicillium mononematosum]|uniref:ankyrin n=1 Tax=Penicillium mononematosum TaxID=268346 RepID=UPI002547CE6E|nr:ankyrin [Penicillium mononematosum]KAJ6189571.1 ankyrin [Penicillium mononematosum]
MTPKNLLWLPTEILEMITLHLEYAYEVKSLSQTCQRLYIIADTCLYKYYAKECPPHVLDRIVMDDNMDALYKLLDNGLNFHQYFRITDRSTPIIFTVDKDLARIAKLLVTYSGVRLQYAPSIFDPAHRVYGRGRDFEKALCRAAYKGSLGVLKVLASSPVVTGWYKAIALRYAVKQSHLAMAKYLIEEAEVNVNQQVPPPSFFESYLAESANQESLEMVKLLVNAGADLKCPSFQRMEQSPLCIAAFRNHGAIVQYLIEMGMCFPRVKLSDILGLEKLFVLPGYTISNVVKVVDIRAIMSGPEYQTCGGYARSCFYRLIAAWNDLPFYQECWEMRDSSDWEHLTSDFEVAIRHEDLTLARYIIDEMVKSEEIGWREWSTVLSYTLSYASVPAFEMLLERASLDRVKCRKGWKDMLAKARDYPKHMEVLLHRGYLDKTKDICILKDMLCSAFKVGNLAFVWSLIEHGELGLFDTLNCPDLGYHQQTVLQIAAFLSPLETFQQFLGTRNLTLDPNNPTHCAALVSAAVGTNIDVVGYFLKKGFEINALYASPTSKEDNVREALTIQVATAWGKVDGHFGESILEAVTAVMVFLLDRGAQIDATNSQGQTALSIALEHENSKLARMLLSRGADPLIALESRDTLSALEELIQIFLEKEHNLSYLDMLRASLETMAARGYPSDDFLRLMPSIEGTLSRPRVIPRPEDAPDSEGPITLPYYEDKEYVRWSHFYLIRELRKQYWRVTYPAN